jgi:hypothetical protein
MMWALKVTRSTMAATSRGSRTTPPHSRGHGKPFTLFAPGSQGEGLEARMRYADQVPGTKIGFAYESSGHFEALARTRRQAERDAAEARAVVSDHQATRLSCTLLHNCCAAGSTTRMGISAALPFPLVKLGR